MNFKQQIEQALETGTASNELILKVENLRDEYKRKETLQEDLGHEDRETGCWEYPSEYEFTEDEEIAHRYYNQLVLEEN